MEFTLLDSAILLLAFLIGAIPFSVIVGKIFFNIDVRKAGSGNPGATNTLRVLGKKAGLSVLLLDIGKGVGAVFLGELIRGRAGLNSHEAKALTGAMSILGHIFSPFLGFKGGKGVATSTGVLFALQPILALIIMVVFVIVLVSTRFVSLGSIICSILFPIMNISLPAAFGAEPHSRVVIVFSVGLALMVCWKHRSNISRLLKGTENKFSF